MHIICIGDSLTQGYGVSKEECWVSISRHAIGGLWCNAGVNGDTAVGMLARSDRLLAQKPDYMLITGGVNDILLTQQIQTAQCAMMAMVNHCVAAGVKPIIGLPIPIMTHVSDNPWAALIDQDHTAIILNQYIEWLYQFISVFRLRKIDFYNVFQMNCDKQEHLYQRDGIYPNAEGHALLAEAVVNSKILRTR